MLSTNREVVFRVALSCGREICLSSVGICQGSVKGPGLGATLRPLARWCPVHFPLFSMFSYFHIFSSLPFSLAENCFFFFSNFHFKFHFPMVSSKLVTADAFLCMCTILCLGVCISLPHCDGFWLLVYGRCGGSRGACFSSIVVRILHTSNLVLVDAMDCDVMDCVI